MPSNCLLSGYVGSDCRGICLLGFANCFLMTCYILGSNCHCLNLFCVPQVIVEKAEKSEVPEIDKKKLVYCNYAFVPNSFCLVGA